MIVVASKLAPCIFCFLSIDVYFVRYHFQFKILTNSMKQTGRYRASWGNITTWFTLNWPLCEEATQNRSGFVRIPIMSPSRGIPCKRSRSRPNWTASITLARWSLIFEASRAHQQKNGCQDFETEKQTWPTPTFLLSCWAPGKGLEWDNGDNDVN